MKKNLDDIIISALELAKIGFYRYLFDGTIIAIDQTTFEYFELEGIFEGPESLIGRKIESLFLYTGARGRLRAEIRKKGKVVGLEYAFNTLKGTEKCGIHNSFFLVDEETGKEAVQTCYYDITQRRKTEKALLASEGRFRDLTENSTDWIWEFDANGIFTYSSPRVTDLLGYLPEEIIGQPVLAVMYQMEQEGGGQALQQFQRHRESREPFANLTHAHRHKNGRKVALESSGIPLFDDQGNFQGYRGIDRDITERIKLEAQLQNAHKLESLGVLAGGIAHDFNNILTAILGNINLVLIDPQTPEKAQKLLTEAEKASIRAKDLTQQLLTFSRGGQPVREAASLVEVVQHSAEFVLHGEQTSCEYTIPENLWLAEIDIGQISQVIQNIVINASQAMPDGGRIKISFENFQQQAGGGEALLQPGNYLKIKLKDGGVGIPANIVDRIFDPYFTTKQKGSGLGLAITHSIITKHNGHIEVQSTPGVGTTFTIFLPAAEQPFLETKEEKGGHACHGKARIMVIDDEAQVRSMIREMLASLGNETVPAKDGAEALVLYEQAMQGDTPIDLVIMDLTIPGGMGGKEAVQKILSLNPAAKVIVSSGYSTDPIMAAPQQYGFCGMLVKPFQQKDLVKVINEALDVSPGNAFQNAAGEPRQRN